MEDIARRVSSINTKPLCNAGLAPRHETAEEKCKCQRASMICHECSYKTRGTRGRKHLNRNPLWYLFADALGEAISNRTLKIGTQPQSRRNICRLILINPLAFRLRATCPRSSTNFLAV